MEELIPILISLGLGTVLGWEREAEGKPAGLRTHTLVCLGSTLFVMLANYASVISGGRPYDPTRVVHGVITGVGFLGAGAIFQQGHVKRGLTTAANIWMAAAIGVAVGVHAYRLALIGTVAALIVLRVYQIFDRYLAPRKHVEEEHAHSAR